LEQGAILNWNHLQFSTGTARHFQWNKQQNTIEILFEDESHFNNEPYVERSWFKRGEKKQ